MRTKEEIISKLQELTQKQADLWGRLLKYRHNKNYPNLIGEISLSYDILNKNIDQLIFLLSHNFEDCEILDKIQSYLEMLHDCEIDSEEISHINTLLWYLGAEYNFEV